jgi:ketosteroid isomerase-like protein
MTEHPNADIVRRLFRAFDERDVPTVQALIAEDAVWTFPGARGQLAGEHRGREAIAAFLGKVIVLTSGTFHMDLHDVTASDGHAVALFTGSGQRNGKTLHNPTALVITIRDGQCADFREFVWNLPEVDDFWS